MAAIRKFVVVTLDGRLKLDVPVESYTQGARDLLGFAARPRDFTCLSQGEPTRIGVVRTGSALHSAMTAFNERKSA